ncbi:MAG: ABC transporter permease subunit [bacterium]|nr:ABC transporter permease subunit [bacterium]
MIGKLIWKEIRENFINSMIFAGVILTATIYGTLKNFGDIKALGALSILIAVLSFVMVLAYAIYRGYSTIKREKDRNTLEFLLSLPVDGREIVVSKFLAFAIEALFLSLCITIFSHLPLLTLLFSKAVGSVEFKSGAMTITYITFHFFLLSLFVFIVFQFYEILILSLKTKSFFLNALLFFAYLYIMSAFMSFLKKLFNFLPQGAPLHRTFGGEELIVLSGLDCQGLAAGALASVALIILGIFLFNKKVEV